MASNCYFFRMDNKNSNFNGLILPIKQAHYPRLGHKVLQLDDSAYIVGGITSDGSFVKTILKFSFEKFRIQSLPVENSLGIQGFSLFSYKSSIFIWGGNIQEKTNPTIINATNTLKYFDGKIFSQCEQFGQIPSPRAFHCSAWVANRFLLVFGGYSKHETFSDWHILDVETKTWKVIKNYTKLAAGSVYQFGWTNGRGILFKMQTVNRKDRNPQILLKNELFQVKITNFTDFSLKIEPLAFFESQVPPGRLDPTIIFQKNEIYMLGGLKDSKSFSGGSFNRQGDFYNDLWVFDFQNLAWSKKDALISIEYGSQALKFKNKLFLFGGIKSQFMEPATSVQIVSLQSYEETIEDKVCQFCRYVYGIQKNSWKAKHQKCLNMMEQNPDPVSQISTTFISKISQLLQNPLYALNLLIDNSLNLSASRVSIKILSKNLLNSKNIYGEQPTNYLYIGDNSQFSNSDQFIRLFHTLKWKVNPPTPDHIYDEQLRLQNQYVLNLRLAGLRVGRSCLYVSKTQNSELLVVYFSDNLNNCPDCQHGLNCFYYKISLKQHAINQIEKKVCNNKINREIIKNNVSQFLSQEEYLDTSLHTTKFYIFQLYDICETELGYVPTGNFFNCPPSNKQNIIYYDIGFSDGGNIENNGWYNMVTKLYLNPYLGRKIQIQNSQVFFTNIAEKFRQDSQNSLIEKIEIPDAELNMFQRCSLYKITSINYHCKQVFIYHDNRMITQISTKQKSICGFIEIPHIIETDIFKSKISKLQDHKKLMIYLDSKDFTKKRQRSDPNVPIQNNSLKDAGRKLRNMQLFHVK